MLLLALAGPAAAQTRPATVDPGPAPASAIWIGNSFFYFNNGINAMFGQLVQAARLRPVRQSLVTISGSGFDWHDVASYFRPNAIGRYSFDAQNVIRFNNSDRLFDVAILMDCSQCPLHPVMGPVFPEVGRRHAETVRAAGARPVFFMSWAYRDEPEMTRGLADAYTRLGNETGALVIPAGLAFAAAREQRPDIELYMADLRHPTPAGTYLAALVSFWSLFRDAPRSTGYTAGLPAEHAAALQRIAAETVSGYFAPR
ncbi:MAG: hypothetical protein K2X11_10095 [Acetobacteraceae bacterium]|nr:hypothetical protein [Acetobacteraceae bacterium]